VRRFRKMSIFSKLRRAKQAADGQKEKKAAAADVKPPPAPYKHVPTHAATDALLGAPATWREEDKKAIKAQHQKRQYNLSRNQSSLSNVTTLNRDQSFTSMDRSLGPAEPRKHYSVDWASNANNQRQNMHSPTHLSSPTGYQHQSQRVTPNWGPNMDYQRSAQRSTADWSSADRQRESQRSPTYWSPNNGHQRPAQHTPRDSFNQQRQSQQSTTNWMAGPQDTSRSRLDPLEAAATSMDQRSNRPFQSLVAPANEVKFHLPSSRGLSSHSCVQSRRILILDPEISPDHSSKDSTYSSRESSCMRSSRLHVEQANIVHSPRTTCPRSSSPKAADEPLERPQVRGRQLLLPAIATKKPRAKGQRSSQTSGHPTAT
jgi:hypothetical protein